MNPAYSIERFVARKGQLFEFGYSRWDQHCIVQNPLRRTRCATYAATFFAALTMDCESDRWKPFMLGSQKEIPMKTKLIALFKKAASRKSWGTVGLLLVCLLPAHAQKYEITPFIGARSGGTLKVADETQQNRAEAGLKNSASFGIAGGFRFAGDSFDQCDDCSYIGFRWIRQKTNLKLEKLPAMVNPLDAADFRRPAVTLDHFLGDFSYDWVLEDAKMVRPFLIGSLGAARMSAPAGASTKFAFGLGGGVKVFPHRRWGIRFQAEWLPIVTHATVENLVCAGGCMIRLGGGLMNQFEVSIGPVLRF